MLGEGIGFWCFKTAFSKFLIRTIGFVYSLVKGILLKINAKIRQMIERSFKFFANLSEKVKHLFKKRLKIKEDIVYTEKNGIRGSDTDERQGKYSK